MTKRYNSGRVHKLPQSGITSDRYEFLGLEQAEPDLGDPIVGVSSVEANPFNGSIYDWYLVGSDGSGGGKRYWLPKHIVLADSTRTAGSITIRSNNTVIGFANGVSDLNFKGGISIVAPGTVAGIGNSGVDIFIENVPEADRADEAGSLEGGVAGSIPYQQAPDTTIFLPGPAAERQVLSYNTSAVAPVWRNILELNPIEVEQKLQNRTHYLSYFVSTGSTSTVGITTNGLSFNPSEIKLGIGTNLASTTLDVRGTLSVTGLSTLSNLTVTGTSTLNNLSSSGISTLNNLIVSGISTFNNNVGIGATFAVSGISTFSNNVSISKTDALLNVASKAVFTGLTTVNTLTASAMSPDGLDYGTNLYVPVANNTGSWSWQPVFNSGAGSIDGVNIFENSALKGSDIINLNFENPNYTITVNGTTSNINFSNTPRFNSVTVGPSTSVINVTVNSSGINATGIVTASGLKITGNATIDTNLTVSGDLTVNGNTTTINSTILTVDDKNIELASTASPSDTTADGGGIILVGASNHTILWSNTNDSWDFSEHVNIITGKEYRINNTKVLDSTTLGAGVTNSSLKTLGTIITGVWEGSQINDDYIGTINNSNKISLNALDIDGGTATTVVDDGDLFIIDDGANGTNRKVTASIIKSYVASNLSFSGSLNGNLDLNGNNIIGSSGNISISGNIQAGIITSTSGFSGNLTGTADSANNLNRDVTAGNGLTGGGTLTSNVTLNVGAGTGITVNSNDIALKNSGALVTNKYLKWDGTQLVSAELEETGGGGVTGTVSFATTAANLTRSVNTNGGLTGGGGLTQDRTLSLSNNANFSGNNVLKWDGSQFTNSNITDNGTLVTIGSNIKLGGIQDSTNATGATNYVPIANGSGGWSWGQLTAGSVSGVIQNIVDDTTPQLGGDLDLNGKNITGTGNINITGIITASGGFVGTATTANNLNRSVNTSGGLTGGGGLTQDRTLSLANNANFSGNNVLKWDGSQFTNSNITDNGSLVTIGSTIKLGGIQDSTNATGAANNIPIANGTGGWSWGAVTAAGGINGISVREEETTAFTGITELKFVGVNVTATASSNVATITIPDTVSAATTASNLNRNVDTPTDGGLTGGGTLTSNLNIRLKNYSNLTNTNILKWDGSGTQLTNSNISDNGTLVTVGSTIKLGGIQDSTNATGANKNVPIANGSGGWAWGTINTAGGITGVTISKDGSAISASSFTNINFVSPNITAADAGSNMATITLTSTPTFTNVNVTGIMTAATYDVSSDINLKDNIQIIENPLDKIIRIDGVTFNWKSDNKPSMGVIAQNIEEVLPELVSTSDTKHVNYNGIIGLLIEAIKELKSEVDELKRNK